MWLRLFLAGAVVAGLTGFAPAPVPKTQRSKVRVPDDLVRLKGLWQVVSYERPGLKNVGGIIKTAISNVRIADNKWAFMRQVGNDLTPTVEYDMKVDPNGTPKKMDLVRDLGGNVMTLKGIYKFEGNRLKVLYVSTYTARAGAGVGAVLVNQADTGPLSFENPPVNAILYTLERAP